MRGFTLIELAVVLVLIGLITGIVIGGSDILEKSKGKAALAEMQNYEQAFSTFQTRYRHRPGDMANAADNFTGDAAVAGNANGRIDTPSERDVAWPQLFQAQMISTNLSTVTTPTSDIRIIGEHRPQSGVDGGGWTWVDSYDLTFDGTTYTYDHVLRLGGQDGAAANGGEYLVQPILSIKNHSYVDSKIDTDNTPLTGKVTVGETSCVRLSGSVPVYATDSDLNCTLNFVEKIGES